MVLAGVAGLVAGAMSMAAGEYVSVKTQKDIELADLKTEAEALKNNWNDEHRELADIYVERGLDAALADEVARQLMQKDALTAHARDEIGITSELEARPMQAALWSAGAFFAGGVVPVIIAAAAPVVSLLWIVPIFVIGLLGGLGAIAAVVGGASPLRGAIRVCFWGSLAMVLTAGVGKLFRVSL